MDKFIFWGLYYPQIWKTHKWGSPCFLHVLTIYKSFGQELQTGIMFQFVSKSTAWVPLTPKLKLMAPKCIQWRKGRRNYQKVASFNITWASVWSSECGYQLGEGGSHGWSEQKLENNKCLNWIGATKKCLNDRALYLEEDQNLPNPRHRDLKFWPTLPSHALHILVQLTSRWQAIAPNDKKRRKYTKGGKLVSS